MMTDTAPLDIRQLLDDFLQTTERLQRAHEALEARVEALTSELEVKNRELARKNRLAVLGEMAACLAHEIRNPLGGLELYAGLLQRELAGQAGPMAELVRKIQNAISRLNLLVSDILDFGGELRLDLVRVELAEWLEGVTGEYSERLGEGTLSLTIDPAVRGREVELDPARLSRVVDNLLRNAVEASPSGATIVAALEAARDGGLQLSVRDSGPGIPPETLGKIFTPFYTQKAKGTGLGLAIAHRIVTAHGGTIRAENLAEGGAVFSVLLPAAPASCGRSEGES